ncbi:adhesion G -coupled receptor F5-like isoform X3 [Labeo rohita]|uniref:Adhesion G-coupled receptor F5-like isoform X3 n=1 Tax=Labeo rohita TaxID=84645 RepID=A0A498NYA5_LABRO|nr:adhesion G -coupled receptor F5-like isoform X3 [Labeo rohita]
MDSSITNQLRNLLMSFSLPYTISDSTNITEINITTVLPSDYMIDIDMRFFDLFLVDYLRNLVKNISLPLTLRNSINVTDIDMTTVLPSDYMIDIDMRFFDLFLVDYLRNLVKNISLPLTLRNSINVTDIDMTTVCGLNGTEYECKCEENHVWPNDTCRAYQVCDGIVGGTCGCIQALPSDGPLCQRVALPLSEYLIEIQINSMDSRITNQLRNLLMSFSLPYTISDSTNITEINITTVCSLNQTQYQCKCEGLFVWPNDTCHSYETCDNITDVLPSKYVIDIDMRFFDLFLADYLRNLVKNISLPLTLRNSINVTDIDMTTVCGLNGTEYECKCEENHVWPNDTCSAYEVCDGIVGGTCGCIQALPSDGPLCQRVTLPLTEYLIEIQINSMDSRITNQLRNLLMSFSLPYTISDSTNITEINITTVLPSKYVIDIDMRFFDLFLADYLRNLVKNISLPLTLRNSINVTDIDMTTVCGLNGTEYECKCEENHVWPNDTCRAYEVCDGIVGGTCGCIQALPSDGPLCQRAAKE